MATSRTTISTTETQRVNPPPPPPTLVLELNNPRQSSSRVRWTEETIDNEHLNKKKSKCCCIYTKPHNAQSTDDRDNEFDNCEHCRFHTESDYSAKAEDRPAKIQIIVGKTS